MAQTKKQKTIKEITPDDFRPSTSSFRQEEEKALKITISSTDNEEDIFNRRYIASDEDINHNLSQLYLENFNKEKIITYVPSKEDELSTNQRRFLGKLKLILINNDPDSEAPNCERFIDDLLSLICDYAELDDGLELTLRPCNLKLKIGDNEYAAIADKEGRRGQELTWILQEDKHRKSSTYKHGDLQLACAMIAATQHNYNLLEQIYPKKIMGLKAIADTMFFCSMEAHQKYIDESYEGLPKKNNVTMYKFPSKGLLLSNPDQRKKFFKFLTSIRKEALSVKINP